MKETMIGHQPVPPLLENGLLRSDQKKQLHVVSHLCYASLSPSFSDKVIRHRACSLKDTAHAIFAAELDPEFDRMCEEIKEARKKRGKEI